MAGCRVCAEYSFQLQRCRLGKINPRTIKGGVDAAEWMGISYICGRSKLKVKIMDQLLKKRVDIITA